MSVYDGSQVNVVKLNLFEHFPVSASKLKQRTLVDRVEEVREKRRNKGSQNSSSDTTKQILPRLKRSLEIMKTSPSQTWLTKPTG